MNKCTMYLLVFMLITGPGLNKSVHAGLCDPTIAPCNTGSCMPCNLEKEQSKVDQNDCANPNGCPEVTKVRIEPPPIEYMFPINRPPFSNPLSKKCRMCANELHRKFLLHSITSKQDHYYARC